MSVADNTNTTSVTQEQVQQLHSLFSQLEAQQVEMFYKHYQQWRLTQQVAVLQDQLATIEQHIVDNDVLMQLTQPSPIALATLTRLQSYGVDDIDLLDNMLERGDTWLDHTLQLLEQCERLDFIHDNYTEWCLHALEGAYDWLDSIHENEEVQLVQQQVTRAEFVPDDTEALLVQKLMSEDETLKIPAVQPISASQQVDTPSVPTDDNRHPLVIPSMLSYPMNTSVDEKLSPVTTASAHEIPCKDKQQKSPRVGLIARIMAKVWQT